VLDEALHLLDAGVDSLELQIAAELLVAPGPDRVKTMGGAAAGR
jgi:hypothetical protein